ncbi:uncharacterized protein BJ212DRAFT_1295736 [Suillus subaureus]|uniref:Uncharacterized protein n=1 Tax=Suillus subaureus TaxID=48587 RepID=A0A9P7ELY3_9AGAM|nr:uncharacterized protein BJ212DRAFT_1295736 [Suillus subaureus]KAG1824603.1 hypothetical protein BJ212DRAFT_1295736 [Suillus subaureus]
MQCALDNTLLESSADHQDTPHVDTLVTLVLRKRSHQRSDSLVAITPSAMDDSSSAVSSELDYATTDEPSMQHSEELVVDGDTAPLTPQSDAQRLAALVRLKMTTDEPLQSCLSSYSEESHCGRDQSSPTSPQGSIDLSMHPSDLTYIDSILAQDEALEVEAMARLQKSPMLRLRMRKRVFSICVGGWRGKDRSVEE